MDDFQPFLQIVHISDLHITDPRSSDAATVRATIRKVRRWSKRLAQRIADGMAPHDELAVPLLKEFIQTAVTGDPTWKKGTTWLVDTGDVTSLGDLPSLDLGRQYLQDLASVCSSAASTYGNHDAWPGKFPLFANRAAIKAQSDLLESRNYAIASPRCSLSVPIPNGAGKVHLYFIDSVIHDRLRNTCALGEINGAQLDVLKSVVDQTSTANGHDFRILAVHHPVHYPPPRPSTQMVMRNDRRVGSELDTKTPGGIYPVVHLVLSGHTHSLYPAHGTLPPQPTLCDHQHLGNDQCQLVVGSLMQLDRFNLRLRWPHQCQLLRLYYSPSRANALFAERLLIARQAGQDFRGTGIGPYGFVALDEAGTRITEPITFAL
jgi:3',5'-cyclic AMP phosphodiesterase CpdA